jgi:ActR/RegA family two-component response regulator
VLCDLLLGDGSGWDVADALHDRAPSSHFYLVTGWAEEISPDDPRGRHVIRVLPKPLGVDELERVLADAAALPGTPAPPCARDPSTGGLPTPAPP